ncbi:MAG TPA: sigma-70 family RNA polymerase sigma factor [Methylomirabilota bacterium]|nr:sigma-70 family RNA polymerase sigma factor [Methylomirabilota bacterium]
MDLEALIGRVREGDLDAFAEVTRRFQQMAFGYAVALLRDLQQAEDVVQEAFVAAWFGLPTLSEPAAFPGWLRSIVRNQAHRLLRQKQLQSLPISAALAVPGEESGPDHRLEQSQRITAVLDAIGRLSDGLREVVTLFYVHECTQQDIATFLGLPLTTVNNRLHAARTQLKRRTLTMVKDTLPSHRLPDDFAARIGRIVRARDGVVDVLFDPTNLPDLLTELTVSDQTRRRAVTVRVVQLLKDGVVRCVPVSPGEGLTPGMTVLSSGRHAAGLMAPEALDGAVRRLPGQPAETDQSSELLETGIKVIDVLCPLTRGGTVAVAGEYRAGTFVVVEELCWRLRAEPGGASIFAFVAPGPSVSFQEALEKEGYTGGTAGTVQTFYFAGEEEWTTERLARLPSVDVAIRLSYQLARARIYPTIDALTSRSRLQEAGLVDPEHAEIAARVRALLAAAAGDDPDAVVPPAGTAEIDKRRARKLWLFFAQPFFVAEPYTKRPGVFVSRAEALRGCREILDGVHDDLPDEAFYFTGGIDEIRAGAST